MSNGFSDKDCFLLLTHMNVRHHFLIIIVSDSIYFATNEQKEEDCSKKLQHLNATQYHLRRFLGGSQLWLFFERPGSRHYSREEGSYRFRDHVKRVPALTKRWCWFQHCNQCCKVGILNLRDHEFYQGSSIRVSTHWISEKIWWYWNIARLIRRWII